MKNYQKLIDKIRSSKKFQELAKIGGHKEYHLEGNALIHTDLVVEAAEKKFGKGHFMVLVALLHDIGKIWTSVNNEPDNPDSMNWSYPHHSDGGAEHLKEFIPESMKEFKAIQWYIYNHIQPLYWQGKDMDVEIQKIMKRAPIQYHSYCNMTWLRDLAICDLKGSKSLKPQDDLINFLKGLDLPYMNSYTRVINGHKYQYFYKYEGHGIFKIPGSNKEFYSVGEVMDFIENRGLYD